MKALRLTVSSFGVVAGLAGIEHGIGELAQGNVAADGLAIRSWPDTEAFAIVGGEPALTIVPNLLATGLLAILVSLAFMMWAVMFVEWRHGGPVLIGLSLVMLLVGGGFGPPILGVLLGAGATKINAPLHWWHVPLLDGPRQILAQGWRWLLMAGIVAWLLVMPGLVLVEATTGMPQPALVAAVLIVVAFASLLLAIAAASARDAVTDAAGLATASVAVRWVAP